MRDNDGTETQDSITGELFFERSVSVVPIKEEDESPNTVCLEDLDLKGSSCRLFCLKHAEVTIMDCLKFLYQQKQNGIEYCNNKMDLALKVTDRIFVLDISYQNLLGYLTMQDLLVFPVECKITSLLRKFKVILQTRTSLKTALRTFCTLGTNFIPVADSEEVCRGSPFPRNNCLKRLEESQTNVSTRKPLSSFHSNSKPTYFKSSLYSLVLERFLWLLILLLLQSVSSVILDSFQELIEKHLVISLFLTMLIGTGGNAGSQSSAIVIRGLATGEIQHWNSFRALKRELFIALFIAASLSCVAFIRVVFTVHSSKDALTISIALFVLILWAVAVGTLTPLFLEYCGADPAHCASPILATATDVVGVFVTCIVATTIFHY
ncbi:hypothetical protein GpartN1_g5416.t1 [Galdieria partita]|uniref:SLC41A/MgtE integral membrane domain-containing protein n=1 Tax=Galdieria partita TaxID=83374 RepID=A0A9C7Q057_9RHOD|nr:hypothetical protein GpartN1_g5416.t1 [Galdieria partita]